jgi:hypothetical protein
MASLRYTAVVMRASGSTDEDIADGYDEKIWNNIEAFPWNKRARS